MFVETMTVHLSIWGAMETISLGEELTDFLWDKQENALSKIWFEIVTYIQNAL